MTTTLPHTMYTLDELLYESEAEQTILVTRYESPVFEDETRVDVDDAISEEILAGLVNV